MKLSKLRCLTRYGLTVKMVSIIVLQKKKALLITNIWVPSNQLVLSTITCKQVITCKVQ